MLKFKAKVDVTELKKFLNSFNDNVITIYLESKFLKDEKDLNSESSYAEILDFIAGKIDVISESSISQYK